MRRMMKVNIKKIIKTKQNKTKLMTLVLKE